MARKKSQLYNSVTKNLVDEQSLGEDIVLAVETVLTEEATKLQKKFDLATISKMMSQKDPETVRDPGYLLSPKKQPGTTIPESIKEEPKETLKSVKPKTKKKKDSLVNNVPQGRVVPLRKNDSAADLLGKLYNLLSRDFDNRKKQKEISDNFNEENKIEEERRHQEFLKALSNITGNGGGNKENASNLSDEIKDSKGSLLGNILQLFGGLEMAATVLEVLGAAVASPIGLAFMGAIVAGSIGKFLRYLLTLDKTRTPQNTPTLRGKRDDIEAGEAATNIADEARRKIPRVEIEEAVKNLNDSQLKEEYGKNKEELKKWLDENPDKGAQFQAPVKNVRKHKTKTEKAQEKAKEKAKKENKSDTVVPEKKDDAKNNNAPPEQNKETTKSSSVVPENKGTATPVPNTKQTSGADKEPEKVAAANVSIPAEKNEGEMINKISQQNASMENETPSDNKPVVVDASQTINSKQPGTITDFSGDPNIRTEEETFQQIISRLIRVA